MAPRPRRLLVLAAAPSSGPALVAQTGIVQLTQNAEVHQDAKISPDGQFVAFRGPGKIGIVGFTGVGEATLVSSGTLGSFLWAPSSSGLYFVDGSTVLFVGRGGGAPQTVRMLSRTRHALWDVDGADSTLYGTRFDATNQIWSIFTLPTDGSAAATDIVTSQDALDEVRLDPSEGRILYRQVATAPFSPHEYWAANPDGSGKTSLTGMPLSSRPEDADWVDDPGRSIAFTVISAGFSRPHVGRIGPSGTTVTMLTDGTLLRRFTSVSGDRRWIAMQAQTSAGTSPAVLPPRGGGLVLFGDESETYDFQGLPTMDASGSRLVFAASLDGALSQVYGVTLNGELRITPRAETGSSFSVEMPVPGQQAGVVLLGGLLQQSIPVPGFAGSFWLDPSVLVTLASGAGTGGKLSQTVPVPLNPWLVGKRVWLQGVRVAGVGGNMTHRASVRIF